MSDTKFPSESKNNLIEVLYMEGEDLLIIGCHGHITLEMLSEIDCQIIPDWNNHNYFPQGEGHYLFKTWLEGADYDHCGRMMYPSYWDFELISYKPLEFQDE